MKYKIGDIVRIEENGCKAYEGSLMDNIIGSTAEIVAIHNYYGSKAKHLNYCYELCFIDIIAKRINEIYEDMGKANWQDDMLVLVERPKEIEIDNMDVFNSV